MLYNKGIKMVSNFSDIAAYDEFFQYCDKHNLSVLQTRILREILAQHDDWDVSPAQMAKKFNKDKKAISLAINGDKTHKGLIEKLNGDIVVVFKSNGGNSRGHLFNAHKVYDTIYNMIMERANGITNRYSEIIEIAFNKYIEAQNNYKNLSFKFRKTEISKFDKMFGKYLEVIYNKHKENYNDIINEIMYRFVSEINYPSDIVNCAECAEQSIGN